MDEDSRFVLDIAVLEVATGFLFFCVKNIMQGEFGTIFAGQYTQKTQASVRQQIPKYVMAATGGFFFRNIDILWINRGLPGSPPWWRPPMDREPTMDAMLLSLGGTIFLNQKLAPGELSWRFEIWKNGWPTTVVFFFFFCCVF